MTSERFQAIAANYAELRVAVVGDFCLDRYLEIDPAKGETSIETGLPVHNVVHVRAQPGAAGTILNNLVALGVGTIHPVGFCGEDGEGFELRRALASKPGINLDHFLTTPLRRTFSYCKPLMMEPARPPRELNRLDTKNWTPTPALIEGRLIDSLARLAFDADAVILMDQVELAETGVVTRRILEAVGHIVQELPDLLLIADSRRSLHDWPPVCLKMNGSELAAFLGSGPIPDLADIKWTAAELARRQGRRVFVTLAERGLVGAWPDGGVEHVPALPLRGEIDVVGAGDSVTANLAAALAARATLAEALEIAAVASSIVIHQLGTTGTATIAEIRDLLPETKG